MMGLSYLSTATIRALAFEDRRPLTAGTARATAAVTLPQSASRLRTQLDMPSGDRLNPTLVLDLTCEVSLTNGATWMPWGHCTIPGTASADLSVMPALRVRTPPAGALVRASVRASGQSATALALVIRPG